MDDMYLHTCVMKRSNHDKKAAVTNDIATEGVAITGHVLTQIAQEQEMADKVSAVYLAIHRQIHARQCQLHCGSLYSSFSQESMHCFEAAGCTCMVPLIDFLLMVAAEWFIKI